MKKSKIILHEETRLLYEGTDLHVDGVRPDSPPIYPATAYIMRDLQELSNQVDADGFVYNRCQNPDRFALGDMISNLELGKHTLVCSSGMNAICVTMLATLEKGDHVVANAALYGEVIDFISNILPKYGIEVTFANFLDTEEVHKAIKPQTKMLYTEIIANPLTEVIDVKEIANIAHQHNALLVVDSTVTTPFVIRPLEFGADIVLHSLTKYFGGHSDLTAGSVTLNDDKVYQTIRNLYILMGCATDSVTSWLCMRSIRTMGMRMDRQLSNAEKLAEGLSKCPNVRKVVHPSLNSGVRAISARQALEMATLNGARVWGLENEIGSIKEGKSADFILVSTEEPHMQPIRIDHYNNVLSMLAFCATGHDVDSTYINGKPIMKNRRMLHVNQEEIIRKACIAGEKCLRKYNPTELYRHEK